MGISRTRTRDDLTGITSTIHYEYCNGTTNDSTSESQDVGLYSGESKTTTDVVTPDFHKRVKRGEIINNPFSSTTVEHGFSLGTYVYKRNPALSCTGTTLKKKSANQLYAISDAQGRLDAISPATTIEAALNDEIAQLKTIVGTRCYAGVVPAEVSGLTELAEFVKTIKLIRKPAESIHLLIHRIRRSKRYKRSRAKDVGSYIADQWLQLRYGFTPLVFLMQDATKAVFTERRSKRQTSRSSSTTSTYSDSGTFGPYSHATWNHTEPWTIEAEATVRAGQLYEHTFTLEDHVGMGLHDLPATLWEILPYSFVFDWIANFGDYIRATTPKAGVRHIADWTTVEKTVTRTITPGYTWSGGTSYQEVTPPSGSFSRTEIEKVRNPGISVGLSSKHQSINFEAPKDWIHLADLISLIGSSLSYR